MELPSNSGTSNVVDDIIDDCQRRLSRGELFARLAALLACAALVPLGVVMLDHAVSNGLPRVLIIAFGLSWFAATVWAILWMLRNAAHRRTNAAFAARLLEHALHIKHNPLVNTILLGRSEQTHYAAVVSTREALAALSAAEEDPARAVPRSFAPLLLMLLSLGVWLFYASIATKPILPSLERMFGVNLAAPTATRLVWVKPRHDQAVYVGDPLEVEVEVRGAAVADVMLEVRRQPGPDAPPALTLPLVSRPDGDAARRGAMLAPHEVGGDLYLRCVGGDAELQRRVEVWPLPTIESLKLLVRPPAYTGLKEYTTASGRVEVWAGTEIEFEFAANAEIRDPVLVFSSRTETRSRMQVAEHAPRTARATLPLRESGEYWIEFNDRRGHPYENPVRRRIVVHEDGAPEVEIISPSVEEAQDGIVDVREIAQLEARARDDILLRSVTFVVRRGARETRSELLSTPQRDGKPVDVAVSTEAVKLEVGERADAWFEAADAFPVPDKPQGGRVSKSRVLVLTRSEPPPEPQPQSTPGADENAGDDARDAGAENAESGSGGGGPEEDDNSNAQADQRSEQGGAGERAADDSQASDAADKPEQSKADENAEGRDAPQQDKGEVRDQEGGSGGDSEKEQREFSEELKKFAAEHGDEAEQINEQRGDASGRDQPQSQPADDDADSEKPPADSAGQQQRDKKPAGETRDEKAGDSPKSDENAADAGDESKDTPESHKPESRQDKNGPTASRPAEQDQPSDIAEPKSGRRPKGEDSAGQKPTDPKKENAGQPGDTKSKSEPPAGSDQSSPSDKPGGEQTPPATTQQPNPNDPGSGGGQPGRGGKNADAKAPADPGEPASQPADPNPPQTRPADAPSQPNAPTGDPKSNEDQPADDAPPPSVPPQPGAPAVEDDLSAAGVKNRELLNVLNVLERAEELSDDQLADLGWPAPQRSAFLDALKRLDRAARRAGFNGRTAEWLSRGELGTSEVTRGAPPGAGVSRALSSESLDEDPLERIAAPAEQRVSPELKRLLDAYYRTLAKRRESRRRGNAP